MEDELIREVTINCAERGLLLLRVRDEIRMTIAAYQTLYESSVAFGMRKALQAEQGKSDMERKVSGLDHEAAALREPSRPSQGHLVVLPGERLASEGGLAIRSLETPGFRAATGHRAIPVADLPLGGSTDPGKGLGWTAVPQVPSSQALPPPCQLGDIPGVTRVSVLRLQNWKQKREIWRGK